MAIDYTTPAGQVRLLIPDTDETVFVFGDPEIDGFLALELGNVFRAAALAVETIATNEALVLKVIDTLDVKTDGAKLSDALLKRAAQLRARADETPEEDDDGDFAVAEFADPVFGARQYWDRAIWRGAV